MRWPAFGDRGIYHDGWSACTKHSTPWELASAQLPAFSADVWELYGPDDWSQAQNLAGQNPAKLRELQQLLLLEGRQI